jgi:hypothetical protein
VIDMSRTVPTGITIAISFLLIGCQPLGTPKPFENATNETLRISVQTERSTGPALISAAVPPGGTISIGVHGVDRREARPVLIRIEAYPDHRMLLEQRVPITREWPRIERDSDGEITLTPNDSNPSNAHGGSQ